MTTVAIIGAGPLGRWLAREAARAGFRVLLEDVMPGNLHHAQEYLRTELNSGAMKRDLRRSDEGSIVVSGGVEFVSTIEDAVREADLAIDCVPDELESKLEILWLLDRMAPPKTVLATPTTRLEIADLAGCTYRAEKCLAITLDPRDFARVPETGVVAIKTTERTTLEALAVVRGFWVGMGFRVEVS